MIYLIGLACLVLGFLLGLHWSSRLLRRKYEKLFLNFKNRVADEEEQFKLSQKKIAEHYKQIIQEDLYDFLLETAHPPPFREDMN